MPAIDRRRFLKTTAGAAALGTAGVLPASTLMPKAIPAINRPLPLVCLGRTGIETTRLCFGTGGRWNDPVAQRRSLRVPQLTELIRHAFDRGIRLFDLADLYGTHACFREALVGMDRSQVTILTKLWWRYDGPEEQANLPARRRMTRATVERFRRELAVDQLEIVLLHGLTHSNWDKQLAPYIDALSEEKSQGRIRAVGCSCQNLAALQSAAQHPWVDIIQTSVNIDDGLAQMTDGSPDEVEAALCTARQRGKAIIGMSAFDMGHRPSQYDAQLKYLQESDLVDAIALGFETPEQIDNSLHLIHKHPAKQLSAG
jgi:predicted aldo/keto reductase-like oxidoreductase